MAAAEVMVPMETTTMALGARCQHPALLVLEVGRAGSVTLQGAVAAEGGRLLLVTTAVRVAGATRLSAAVPVVLPSATRSFPR